jgi:site-specific DNA-methyltransferase (adenine-specific)
MRRPQTNTLYYGDNLPILREYIPDESIDLIYLDPPFNSNRSYNVLFKESTGGSSEAQLGAFDDTWKWGPAPIAAYEQIALHGTDDTARLLKAMVDALGHNEMTAYLSMMAARLIELHRVLKPTGSIYLHCDPTASHYLRVLMDGIFNARNFRSEVVWKRTSAHSSARRPGPVHDVLFFYSKSSDYTWNPAFQPYEETYLDEFYVHRDADGRRWNRSDVTGAGTRNGATGKPWRGIDVTAKGRHWFVPPAELDKLDAAGKIHWPSKTSGMPRLKLYADEQPGVPLQDVWSDIRPLHNLSTERLGYPTQKPLPLLERIVVASSNEGDLILDPFCGCGTAIHAAQKLGRKWIGIDITHLAIGLIRRRMQDAFPGIEIKVVGEPVDLPGAAELASRDPYQFQWWALDKVSAQSITDKKKGMDRGIDGIIPFLESNSERKRVIISVKAGNIGPQHVRDLKGVLEREKEPIGVLLTLKPATREMKNEAAAAGTWRSERWQKNYARVQLLSVADIFNGKGVAMPPAIDPFAKAAREQQALGEQKELEL